MAAGKVIIFTDRGQGTLRFGKVKGNKKITINKSNGTVTVKKKIKKGTYKVKVKVMATGSTTYSASNWKINEMPAGKPAGVFVSGRSSAKNRVNLTK